MSNPPPRPAPIWTDRFPQHLHRPSARADHAEQGTDGGGLARAIQPDKAVNLSRVHAQVDGIDRPQLAVRFRQSIGFDSKIHAAPSVM